MRTTEMRGLCGALAAAATRSEIREYDFSSGTLRALLHERILKKGGEMREEDDYSVGNVSDA